MNTLNKLASVLMLCLWTTGIFAQNTNTSPTTQAAPSVTLSDISGKYICEGQDPFSNPASFKETIIFKKIGDTYNVQMIRMGSVIPYDFGTGIIHKDIPNVISFVYWDPKNINTMGIELLEIKADGSLVGIYADRNKDKVGTQTCTKSS